MEDFISLQCWHLNAQLLLTSAHFTNPHMCVVIKTQKNAPKLELKIIKCNICQKFTTVVLEY